MGEIDISKIDTINVGIVGHIDHGKTTLLYKLTGKWADTHSEELKRGITIKLGYSDTIIWNEDGKLVSGKKSEGKPLRYVTFVDAPGHEMLMATMLSGAAIMDAAILVVAANEGIKPQTREHLVALKAKNIENIIIVQNKIDLVSKEEAVTSYKEIKEFVKGTVAENSPIIPLSAQQGVNLDALLQKLCDIPLPIRETSSAPVFFVARSFDINRPGTDLEKLHGGILGGSLKKGTLRVGDEIEIKPGLAQKKQNQLIYVPIKTKVVSLQKGDFKLNEATPGGSLAMETELDPSLTKADSLTGSVVSTLGTLSKIREYLSLKVVLFPEVFGSAGHEKVDGFKQNEILMLSVNSSTTVGTIKKVKNNLLELSLKIPVVSVPGESVGVARNFQGHWRLIGFGEIVDALPTKAETNI
jgi:translation initiation factor 2 subunit 3